MGIDEYISDPEENKMAHKMVKKHFGDVDRDGSGEVDEHELSAAMKAHEGLAQIQKGKGPSPADIIEACDADGSGGISKDEAHACIDAPFLTHPTTKWLTRLSTRDSTTLTRTDPERLMSTSSVKP